MDTSYTPTHEELLKLLENFTDDMEKEKMKDRHEAFTKNPSTFSQLIPTGSVRSGMELLNAMTGLDKVKETIAAEVNYHRIMKMRREAGRRIPKRMSHMLLTGNPGTGKTTVARLIARIYKEEGILKKGHCVETCRSQIVGKWIGETEQRMSDLINSAMGGVLFIDEIYSLADNTDQNPGATRDFGLRAIDTLMPVLSNPDADLVVIGAGYTSSIRCFLKTNPGIASRFPLTLHFEDFTLEQMMEIADNELSNLDFSLSVQAREKLKLLLEDTLKIKDHGNGRAVISIINNHVLPNLCNRLAHKNKTFSISIEDTNLILPEDIPSVHTLFPLRTPRMRTVGFH